MNDAGNAGAAPSAAASAESTDFVIKIDRGAPMVATSPRWAMFVGVGMTAMGGLLYAYVAFSHSPRSFASFAPWLAGGAMTLALVVLALLRAEESRLARELRTARTGTPLIRDMVIRRRQNLPIFLRVATTTLGSAAVLLAEGDRSAALDALSANSPLMRGGRLRFLREVIEADADRASASLAGLSRCIATLRAMDRIGNAEADRYRTHVLAKAVLQQAADGLALEIANELATATDEEERIYAVWLRVWFDLPGVDGLSDGELRLAALLARTHGAEDLTKKLAARIETLDLALRAGNPAEG